MQKKMLPKSGKPDPANMKRYFCISSAYSMFEGYCFVRSFDSVEKFQDPELGRYFARNGA